MKIQATELDLQQVGIRKKEAKKLAENQVRIYNSFVTNDVLREHLEDNQSLMVHQNTEEGTRLFHVIPKRFLTGDYLFDALL